MTDRILFVDDEINIIQAYRRTLRNKFNIQGVSNGDDALELLRTGDYAVIISDMQMPGMNGIEFLAAAKELKPDIVRVMLTGNADLQTAVDAVNKGDIFRFHNKPCHADILEKTISDGLRQYRLVTAEKELLEGTLTGSIQVLTELLSLINPEAFGRISHIKNYVHSIAKELEVQESDIWKFDTVSSLALIGCIILPDESTQKISRGEKLNEEEQQIFDMHPFVGSDLINKIPRMNEIADGIKYQEKLFNGQGVPIDDVRGKDIPLDARILKVVLDFDRQLSSGKTSTEAINVMLGQSSHYDPDVLATFQQCLLNENHTVEIVKVENLTEGMFLTEDLFTRDGQLVICKGQETTPSVCTKLKALCSNKAILDSIEVLNKNSRDDEKLNGTSEEKIAVTS
ncbi:MAG: response regulator [Proteobacteria bacterium]|nr:response regulator [Pseudomonadota bacterium]NOG60484.1 response regulator [Pseudomonadota bacterium]